MSDTDARILKLWNLGLSAEKITKRIGRPGDYDRIRVAIPNRGICPTCNKDILFNPIHTCGPRRARTLRFGKGLTNAR